MRKWGWRFNIIIASTLVTLALLLGGQWVYRQEYLEKPLSVNLKSLQGIETFAAKSEGGKVEIQLSLGKVPNLRETYLAAGRAAEAAYGPEGFSLEISSQEGPELPKVWYAMQFAVFQAAFQGDFTTMAKTVEEQAGLHRLDNMGLFVDETNIYLQLHKQDENLYRVIPIVAKPNQSGTSASKGGS